MNREILHKICKVFPIFPCKNITKSPLVDNWKDRASNDPDQIDAWCEEFNKYDKKGKLTEHVNFGIPCGIRSGIWAVDVDVKKGKNGFRALAESLTDSVWLEDGDSKVKTAVIQKTPSGGQHFIFKYNKEHPQGNPTDIFGTNSGVDIRGEGGYIIIAPSAGYKMVGVKLSQLTEAPQDILNFLAKRRENARKSGEVKLMEKEDIEGILAKIDPTDDDFQSRDGWQQMMRAVNSASGGEGWGKELFIEWSLRHPGPWDKDVTLEIERDWPSYTPDAIGGTTAGTLMYHAKKRDIIVASPEADITMDVSSKVLPKCQGSTAKMKTNIFNLNILFNYELISNIQNNQLANLFLFNELTREACFFRSPPWSNKIKAGSPVTDVEITNLRRYLAGAYNVDFPKDTCRDAVEAAARENPTNPVKNYLESLEWDGKERLSNWLFKYCYTENTEYYRAVSRKMLIGAVARVYQPGVQMDTMVVLEGPQGCRKSSLVRVLGHNDRDEGNWYAAPNIDLKNLGQNSNAITDCMGAWIIEMEEMSSVNKADEKTVKKFISTREDKITLKYDKYSTKYKRQFIFVGTINPYGSGKYVRDLTGARRYWPVKINRSENDPIDVEAIDAELDQLYAEAVVAYKGGEKHYMQGKALVEAQQHQEDRVLGRVGLEEIGEFFLHGAGADMDRVHTRDAAKQIWPGQPIKQHHLDDITHYLNSTNWLRKRQVNIDGKNATGFIRMETMTDEID